MSTDDLTKLLLAGSLAFAIVLISIGIFMILSNLSGTIKDLRKSAKNISSFSDLVLEDYTNGRKAVYNIMDGFKETILDPLKVVSRFIKFIKGFFKDSEGESE